MSKHFSDGEFILAASRPATPHSAVLPNAKAAFSAEPYGFALRRKTFQLDYICCCRNPNYATNWDALGAAGWGQPEAAWPAPSGSNDIY